MTGSCIFSSYSLANSNSPATRFRPRRFSITTRLLVETVILCGEQPCLPQNLPKTPLAIEVRIEFADYAEL